VLAASSFWRSDSRSWSFFSSSPLAGVQLLGTGLQHLVVHDQVMALDRVAHGGQQFFAQPRFRDEAEDFSAVDGLDDGWQGEHRRDENAGGVGVRLAAFDQEIQAEHFRHALVGDDDRKLALVQDRQRLDGAGTRDDVVALAFEGFLEGSEDDGLVIHDEDGVVLFCHGAMAAVGGADGVSGDRERAIRWEAIRSSGS